MNCETFLFGLHIFYSGINDTLNTIGEKAVPILTPLVKDDMYTGQTRHHKHKRDDKDRDRDR